MVFYVSRRSTFDDIIWFHIEISFAFNKSKIVLKLCFFSEVLQIMKALTSSIEQFDNTDNSK